MAEHDPNTQSQPIWDGERWVQPAGEATAPAPAPVPEAPMAAVQHTAPAQEAPPPSAPAGWYPDPSNPNAAPRYWDGARWLEQQAATASVPVSQGPVAGGGEFPAGWYADPTKPSHEKYWDGRQWTRKRRPKMQAAQPPQAAQVGAAAQVAPPVSYTHLTLPTNREV